MTNFSERDAELFLDLGRYYVPQRERQVAIVVGLVPSLPHASEVIELGGGEGLLAEAILTTQPEATVLDLDGSPRMRAEAERRLARFGPRFRAAHCDLHRLVLPDHRPLRAVVASLALHHVPHEDKPGLYRLLHEALAPGGAMVVADLVRPESAKAWKLAADGWDGAVQAADAAAGAGGAVWRRFQDDRWNWFRYPDEVDRPAPLASELEWLREAGFIDVDVPWADCGHAIFAGRRGS